MHLSLDFLRTLIWTAARQFFVLFWLSLSTKFSRLGQKAAASKLSLPQTAVLACPPKTVFRVRFWECPAWKPHTQLSDDLGQATHTICNSQQPIPDVLPQMCCCNIQTCYCASDTSLLSCQSNDLQQRPKGVTFAGNTSLFR